MPALSEQIKATNNGHAQAASELSAWEMRKAHAKAGCCSDPVAEHDALWALLLERAQEIIASPRRISQQRQAIHAVAKSLELKLTTADVADLYEQLDTTLAAYEPDVEPGQEFSTFSQSWLLDEVFLVGLNLLVGMPGAGKSRLLVALAGAFLNGQTSFLQRRLLSGADRHVLIVGTDQDRQQWGALLAEQGLAEVIGTEVVDGQEKVTYRLHPRIHLKTSGGGFRLDADGMRWVRNWNQQYPGGLAIVDSLSAVLPPGVKEADESAGRLMRGVEVARQGNPCIVTHHTNKQSAMSGELGVYSGSGSGSIDRAISRHIGLAYCTHIEAGEEKLQTESPRRVITSQKRGAANQRLIVENGPFNTSHVAHGCPWGIGACVFIGTAGRLLAAPLGYRHG
jgi:energy-coupling factor transporter ATP-binding protein EcfA2